MPKVRLLFRYITKGELLTKDFRIDILVEREIILELKAVDVIS